MTLSANLRTVSPGTWVADLEGRVDAQAEAPLRDTLDQATAAGTRNLILQFGGVQAINSAGLGQLIILLTRSRRQGHRLLACGLTEMHRQIFSLAGLDEAVEVHSSEAEAVAAAQAAGRLPAQPMPPAPACAASGGWAAPVALLQPTAVPPGVVNLNVQGRCLAGPTRGFGSLWQKSYEIRLTGATVTPREVLAAWKADFGRFWPRGNRFFGRPSGIEPGDVAVLHLAGPGGANAPGGLPFICTGLMVVYVDEESFGFMAAEGHTIAGMITFSAHADQDHDTVVTIEALFRPYDPLFEATFRLGIGDRLEDGFWRAILRNVASHFGVRGEPRQVGVCIDPAVQWARAGNIRYNSAILTSFYILGAPIRRLRRLVRPALPAQADKG
jgi:anti-anti-sigma factor